MVITSRAANVLILVLGIGISGLAIEFVREFTFIGIFLLVLGLWPALGAAYNLVVRPNAWCGPSRPLRILQCHLALVGIACTLAVAASALVLSAYNPVSEALCRGLVYLLWLAVAPTPFTALSAYRQHRREYFTRFQSAV